MGLSDGAAKINPNQFISSLFHKQNEADFAKLFDDTLLDIAKLNTDTLTNSKVHIISISDDKTIDNGAITLNLKSDDKNLKLLAAEFVI